MKNKFQIYGWVNTDICVPAGTFETNMSLKECWDILNQIYQYPEGIFVRRIAWT